jgi:anti-sigma-K factor RskA
MTRRDDDIPAALRDVAAQLRALGPGEWEPAPPPPLRPAVAERHDPAARRRRGRPRRPGRFAAPFVLRPALAAAAALVLVALGAVGGALIAGGDGTPAGREVALAAVGDGPRGAHADAWLRSAAMHLTVSGLPRVGGGGFYEVWMMRDAMHLVALGSFRVGADGRARVDLPVTASSRRFPVLDISREPADGDPAHSGHSVLRSPPLHS